MEERYVHPIYDTNCTGYAIVKDTDYRTYRYYIVTVGSNPCSFIVIPKGHPLYEAALYDHEIGTDNPLHGIKCHGGITIAKHMLSFERNFVIGWEYNHDGDFYLGLSNSGNHDGKKWTLDELVDEAHNVIDQIVEKYGEVNVKSKVEKSIFLK